MQLRPVVLVCCIRTNPQRGRRKAYHAGRDVCSSPSGDTLMACLHAQPMIALFLPTRVAQRTAALAIAMILLTQQNLYEPSITCNTKLLAEIPDLIAAYSQI